MHKIFFIIFLSFNLTIAQDKEGVSKLYDAESGYEIKQMKFQNADFYYTQNFRQDTIKVWTADCNFETPEKYKVGTKFKEFPERLQKQLLQLPAYGYVLRLETCWDLYFCEGETCTDKKPTTDSQVKWIQKGK